MLLQDAEKRVTARSQLYTDGIYSTRPVKVMVWYLKCSKYQVKLAQTSFFVTYALRVQKKDRPV